MCKTNEVYNQKTKRCDMMCEEELIYNINKDICKYEIGKYYMEETSECYLMCKKGKNILKKQIHVNQYVKKEKNIMK